MSKQVFKLLTILLAFCFFSFFYAEDAVILLGGKEGWQSVSHMQNITKTRGLYGFDSLQLLSSPKHAVDHNGDEIDLFLAFDGDVSKDYLEHYAVESSHASYVRKENAKYGVAALACRSNAKHPSLVLSPKEGSFFFGNGKMSSFTIEFWLCPQDLRAGSTILKWWSQMLEKKVFMFQNIVVSIVENKLEWSFFNIWRDERNRGLDIRVHSQNPLPLDKWSHHLLTYDEERGFLEYRINGQIDSVRYLTRTGEETSEVYYSMKGKTSQLSIAEGYSGLLDNLVVKNSFTPQSFEEARGKADRFNNNGGRVVSRIIDTGGVASMPKMISARMETEKEATVAFFVRTSNTPYNWTKNNPEWKAVKKDELIKNCKPGRFFQIAFNLYPTKDGEGTPVIHSINLDYDRDTFAKPPIELFAKEGDGYVDLSWSRSVDFDVKGYLVFFGEREGEYMHPLSPIDAKDALSLRVYKLENGKLYFFSVVSYDENGQLNPGEFSKEVNMRPMKR